MRENGLRATAYIAVADLHPQLADLMLEALADEGVAAYASPSPAASGRGLTMPTQLPAGPVDRLWVDREATATARRVLDDKLPELRAELENATVETVTGRSDGTADGERTPGGVLVDDDTWAEIIASFRSDSATPRRRRSDVEALSVGAEPDGDDTDSESVQRTPRVSDDAVADWPEAVALASAPRPRAPDDPDDHYEPPLPPPLPTADATTRMAWAGVLGGPLVLLLSVILDWNLGSWAMLAAVAALVTGFVTLVARMREGPAEDDDDHGAIV